MVEEGLIVKVKRRRKYNSYQGEISPSVPNRIGRDFHAGKPNEKWLTDITEFAIPAGKVYLSLIVDCFDGMLPYWTVGTTLEAALVIACWTTRFHSMGRRNTPSSILTGDATTVGLAGTAVWKRPG